MYTVTMLNDTRTGDQFLMVFNRDDFSDALYYVPNRVIRFDATKGISSDEMLLSFVYQKFSGDVK